MGAGNTGGSAKLSTNDDDATTHIERYFLSGKFLHRSSETIYQFGKLSAEKDLSSAFDYQLSATAGMGKDVIRNDLHSLSAEIGAGYRYSRERYMPWDDLSEAIATVVLP